MAISVELSLHTSLASVSRVPLLNFSSNNVPRVSFAGNRELGCRFKCKKRLLRRRISLFTVKGTMSKDRKDGGVTVDKQDGGEFVEVIGIGSRKDPVLEFCLESPFQSTSLRFWSILMTDSLDVRLQQRVLEKDSKPNIVESSQFPQSSSKAIILVATAGYGLDNIAAIEILRKARSANQFVVAIVLKPFSFEGRRRLDEVNDLLGKLRDHTDLCIDIKTDMLLQKDLVTLDEALKTAHKAVLLAINTVSVLISDMTRTLLDVMEKNVKELKVPDVVNILENYKNAKVGFGAGHNIETSISRAMYDCPFTGSGVKGLNDMVVCVFAGSAYSKNSDVHAFLQTFRKTTECTGDIIISRVHEPNLEPNMLVTVVVLRRSLADASCEQEASDNGSILSRLAQRFPFVFNLFRNPQAGGNDKFEKKVINGDKSENTDNYSKQLETVLETNHAGVFAMSHDSESDKGRNVLVEDNSAPLNFPDTLIEGPPAFQREGVNNWELGPGYHMAQQWAEKRAVGAEDTSLLDSLSIFSLPVGVRLSKEMLQDTNILVKHQEPVIVDATASILLNGKYSDTPKRQGNLSARAASMLEAERDSPKKWSPALEMQYKGGVYKGRCQGGLPEGKGHLVLGDGSIYDGMWRFGKRSGPGTFYYNNGDVFQGTWRDDVLHGKGWFYFHTGDRWFVNFWKGKASGEGRFYSKTGDVFFGHFKDGWRHGQFLCIDVNGTRWVEIWDDGVLVSRKQSNADSSAG